MPFSFSLSYTLHLFILVFILNTIYLFLLNGIVNLSVICVIPYLFIDFRVLYKDHLTTFKLIILISVSKHFTCTKNFLSIFYVRFSFLLFASHLFLPLLRFTSLLVFLSAIWFELLDFCFIL